MSDFKLKVVLRQITPMIHFQGTDTSISLRATEVKPQLDAFVLGYLKKNGLDVNAIPWIADRDKPEEHMSLKYRMTFQTEGQPKLETFTPRTERNLKSRDLLYLGRMDQEFSTKPIRLVTFEKVHLAIFALSSEKVNIAEVSYSLIELMKELLPAFFMTHCFGARSSKGFGSFLVERQGAPVYSKEKLDQYLPDSISGVVRIDFTRNVGNDEIFDAVYTLSAILKGGVNSPYVKGEIHKYAIARNIGSEKAFLKQRVFTTTESSAYHRSCKTGAIHAAGTVYENYEFVRALLGLPESYMYFSMKKVLGNAPSWKFADITGEIKRFENPIHFKPFGTGILLVLRRIPASMLGREFRVPTHATQSIPKYIKTPATFNLVSFVCNALAPLDAAHYGLPGDWKALSAGRGYFHGAGILNNIRMKINW